MSDSRYTLVLGCHIHGVRRPWPVRMEDTGKLCPPMRKHKAVIEVRVDGQDRFAGERVLARFSCFLPCVHFVEACGLLPLSHAQYREVKEGTWPYRT